MKDTNSVLLLETRVDILERLLENKEPLPVIFDASCTECGSITAHVSHIASKIPAPKSLVEVAATTVIAGLEYSIPIKTCLNCGKTTSRKVSWNGLINIIP